VYVAVLAVCVCVKNRLCVTCVFRTSFPSAASASASASPSSSSTGNVDDPCDDNRCALNSTCVVSGSGNQYTCDCTVISIGAKETVVVGQYCNTTLEGKPISVGAGNCPGCESLFVCDDAYDGSDIESYTDGVVLELVAAYCNCTDPPQDVVDLFGAVQSKEQDEGLCMEFTIYSGNPNATATDIVVTLEDDPPKTFTVNTKRLPDFDPCVNKVDGCIAGSSSDSDSVLWIIIGVVGVIVFLGLGIAWYCVHKRVDKQFRVQDVVTADAMTADAVTDAVTVYVDPLAPLGDE
jgi:hypothetical protein